jgi:myo-inositol-1(or 4)-monophosphatase
MVSLLDGPMLGDVRIGVVHDLTSGERWHAVRGGGLHHDGAPVPRATFSGSRIQVLGVEGSPRWLEPIWPLLRTASKLREMGSIAISLACAATGAFDVFCSAKPGRAFDMTAGMLMVQEAGGVITDVEGRSLETKTAGLDEKGTLLAAATPAAHALALEHLRAAG